jgi:hypothetical protein
VPKAVSFYELTKHQRVQIEMAAMGAVSGTIIEWPHLRRALRALGYELPDDASALEMREMCREVLKEKRGGCPPRFEP